MKPGKTWQPGLYGWLRRPARRAFAFAAITAAVLLPIWRHLDRTYEQFQRNAYRSRIREAASSQAASLSAAVNRRLTLIDGLYAFVQSQIASPRFESEFRSFSTGLYAAAPGIRAIEVVPGTVVRFVYPLAGNEAALNLDLGTDPRPEVRSDLERARKTGRHSLTGPLELRQGGLGLVARRAVFRDGGFWGFVTIVLDVKAILREATVGPQYIRFAVRDSQGRVFHGNREIWGDSPVLEHVALPDGFWELAAVPLDGWGSSPRAIMLVYRVLSLSLVLAVCVLVYLIAERQYRLSRAVRASEEQYRLVTESVPVLISSFDNLGRCRFANIAYQAWFGRMSEEWMGKHVGEILGEEVSGKIRAGWDRLASDAQLSFDAEVPVGSGSSRLVHATCVPQRTEDSAPDGFYLVATDITDRRQAELKLQRSQAQLAHAQAIAHLGSWQVDLNTMELQCSDEARRIFGFPGDEKLRLSRQDILLRVPEPDRERLAAAFQEAAETGTRLELEHRVTCPDGAERWVRLQSEVETGQGRALRLVGTVQDVTEYRMLEVQLRQAQKMEAIGQLAGGVAHDFNNLLSVILGYSELALGGMPESDPWREKIVQIRKAGERAAALTRQLLAFSRRQVLQPRILNLNAIIEDLQKLLQRLIGENIRLVTNLRPGLKPVLVDAGQVEQVIVNLVVNARDAMPDGGTLTIETDEAAPGGCLENAPAGRGRYAVIRITDTGTGIDPEIQPRIFEPFFTTKEVGKGTGLGLSTAYGIVKQSGGEISFTSASGRGTTFSVYLPVKDQAGAERKAEPPASVSRGTETVLLVEDDDAVRSLATVLLRQLGYNLLAASGPAEAIRLTMTHSGPVQLVLTDVIMPGMSGSEMVNQLRQLRPGIKVLYMSGYVRNETVDRAVAAGDAKFVAKPFTSDALAQAVRATLDSE